MQRERYKLLGWTLAWSTALLFSSARAQLNVSSITPSNGSTNVQTTVAIEITFDAPLDTSARFEYERIPLGFFLFPDSLSRQLDDFSVSPDLRSITFNNVQLEADSRYVVAVIGARSSTAGPLDLPAVSTFTTGASLPTGTVSGTAQFPGGSTHGTLVGLFSPQLFSDEGEVIAATVVDGSGAYSIDFVPDRTYLPGAVKDTNGDGELDPFAGDAFALYDADLDAVPDTITVSGGAAISGIDMVLSALEPMTAREGFQVVDPAIKQMAPNAGLIILSGVSMTPEGRSAAWIFAYYDTTQGGMQLMSFAPGQILGAILFGPYLMSASISDIFEGPPADSTYLPAEWIDSDAAVDTANANGGSDFLATRPDADIFATLGNFDFGMEQGQALAKRETSESLPHFLPTSILGWTIGPAKSGALRSAGVAQSRALWFIDYSSDDSSFVAGVDAVTGEYVPIEFGPPFAPSSASDNLLAVSAAATAWATDAELIMIGSPLGDVSVDGQANAWVYVYRSPSKDSVYQFSAFGGLVFPGEPTEGYISTDPLPDTWVNSDIAVSVAEAAGGAAYRQQNPSGFVGAALSRGIYPQDAQRAVWAIAYSQFPTFDFSMVDLVIYVDAETGVLVTGVNERGGDLPNAYTLRQNYPNPFNPETTISFRLPIRTVTRVVVTNVLGQTVAVLLDKELSAGEHRAAWDGHDSSGLAVPSGVYLIRLETAEFSSVRKAVLMR